HFQAPSGRLDPFDRCLVYISVLPDLFGQSASSVSPRGYMAGAVIRSSSEEIAGNLFSTATIKAECKAVISSCPSPLKDGQNYGCGNTRGRVLQIFLNAPKVGRIKTDSSNPYNGQKDL